MTIHSIVLWTSVSVCQRLDMQAVCKGISFFFLITQSVCVASGSEKALNTRRDTIKVIVLAALEGWVTRRTWRRRSPAVHVCRQRHQLHGSLSTSSGGKHSRASLSALAARLPGEGPRQRQHPPRIQQCKRPLSLLAVSPYAALGHSKKRKNTLILYQTRTLMRPSSSGSHCERPQVLAQLDSTLRVLCYYAILFMSIHRDYFSFTFKPLSFPLPRIVSMYHVFFGYRQFSRKVCCLNDVWWLSACDVMVVEIIISIFIGHWFKN